MSNISFGLFATTEPLIPAASGTKSRRKGKSHQSQQGRFLSCALIGHGWGGRVKGCHVTGMGGGVPTKDQAFGDLLWNKSRETRGLGGEGGLEEWEIHDTDCQKFQKQSKKEDKMS